MQQIGRLCVYCGSSEGTDPRYRAAAAALGAGLAARGIELVYGGGRNGLMGVAADAVIAGGGQVTGIIPVHLEHREAAHRGISDLVVVTDMHERKRVMAERADAFAVLPGGVGTLDETIEILTWRQLGLHDKPLVLADLHGYWAPLATLLDRIIETGFAQPDCRRLYRTVASIGEILPALAEVPAPRAPVETKWM